MPRQSLTPARYPPVLALPFGFIVVDCCGPQRGRQMQAFGVLLVSKTSAMRQAVNSARLAGTQSAAGP